MAKRKGNAPGQGRQPTIAPAGQVARITARVSKQQREEYVRRGGSQALREWLTPTSLPSAEMLHAAPPRPLPAPSRSPASDTQQTGSDGG